MIESMAAHESHYVEETILVDLFSPPRKKLMEKGKGFAPDQVLKKAVRLRTVVAVNIAAAFPTQQPKKGGYLGRI